MNKNLVYKIFEGFSIQRWNDLIRPFDMVEMDKAAEKMVIAWIIGKFEENRGNKIDWEWLIYASFFDLLRKIAMCDIKAPVQQMLKKEYPDEYTRLSEWVLSQYKSLINDEELFEKFRIYSFQKTGKIKIPDELKTSLHVYQAAHKFSTIRELEMLSVVNEVQRLSKIQTELQADIQKYLDLTALQMFVTHQKSFEFLLKIEQLRFQTRWNQTPRVPKTSVLGHCYFVAVITLLLCRESKVKMSRQRIINNFFSALFHDLPEAVTRDIISPVKNATHSFPEIVKKIEDEIVAKELIPLMEDFFTDELMYFISNEFSDRILKDKKVHNSTWEEINEKYDDDSYKPVDGRIVRISDHLSALMEADISIKHGTTSSHLVKGRDEIIKSYKTQGIISGINVYEFFVSITS